MNIQIKAAQKAAQHQKTKEEVIADFEKSLKRKIYSGTVIVDGKSTPTGELLSEEEVNKLNLPDAAEAKKASKVTVWVDDSATFNDAKKNSVEETIPAGTNVRAVIFYDSDKLAAYEAKQKKGN